MEHNDERNETGMDAMNFFYANTRKAVACALAIVLLLCGGMAQAGISVTVTGPAGSAKTFPGDSGAFDVNLPLAKNSVNNIVVTAQDDSGNTASKELSITQVSLDQIVVSTVSSERLSVEEVKQLVADGVIDLKDPQNYNVSTFDIVLTIDKKPVSISLPIAIPIKEPEQMGYETYKMPSGDSSSGKPTPPPVQIVVFELQMAEPSAPGAPAPPPIPGVIIIEGNIKSLKEFFSVRLLLMNTSGIFTLSDVMAEIKLPEGKLSKVLPADGLNSFGDILPGDGGQPGQKEKEFIIRGDTIGIHDVTVSFGGTVTGPGITTPIAFNGSAVTNVEVKGPPTFLVEVTHPDSVTAGTPYELAVDITNTGTLTAMYASLELGVGADARIETCTVNGAGTPVCEFTSGPAVRPFGHIEPGQTVREKFILNPLVSGAISSCVAASDQNITLNVYAGNLGCMVGHYAPKTGILDGIPTVTVVPVSNTTGIHEDSAVTAFFSEKMNTASIITGQNGTFNVFNSAGEIVPGTLRFEALFQYTEKEKTVAIWQVNDGLTNRLAPNATYTVVVMPEISDLDGNPLANRWESSFKTTDTGFNDTTPPTVSLSVAPPVDPSAVLPGQIIKINAYASDAGSGVSRVEMRLKDMTVPGALFELIGQKTVFLGDTPPYIFAIDSGGLIPGHTYQAMATAYDGRGNAQNSTLSLIMLASAAPPTVTLPGGGPAEVLQGITITLQPTCSPAVRTVEYFLDSAASPYKTVTLSPFQASLSTLGLALGDHTITVRATDGLDQQGSASYSFKIIQNPNAPVVNFTGVVDGAKYVTGTSILITGTADDPVGIATISYHLDNPANPPLYTGFSPISLNTTGIPQGNHTVYIKAVNNLNISNDVNDPAAAFEFIIVAVGQGPAPIAPVITSVCFPTGGLVTLSGTSVPGAKLVVTNVISGLSVTVYANGAGQFTGQLPGEEGHQLSVVAYDLGASQDPSPAATAIVPVAPVLLSIDVSPVQMTLSTKGASAPLSVTGTYAGGATADLTGVATFSSTNPAVVSVGAEGRVVAQDWGEVFITATVSGHQAQMKVISNFVSLTGITVEPSPVNLVSLGETRTLTVTGFYNHGSPQVLSGGISFVTGNAAVATVNSSGVITAVANGNTGVSVLYPGLPAVGVTVTVNTAQDTPPTIEILSPANGTIVERGESVSVTVRAQDAVGGVTGLYLETSGATVHADSRQITPPNSPVTHSFVFTVSNAAVIGNTISATVWARDTSNNTSPVATITLTVADKTSPSVTITAPAQKTAYNYGDTVNITVAAEDAVGVSLIRFETTGALIRSGSNPIPGFPTSATASFSFQIPYGVSAPDVQIRAYAMDAQSNEGAAIPVEIILTDADITPPATIITAVADPGAGATATVAYQITSGLTDLDHVELYFRRNGIGTFNRFTDTDSDNPKGHYTPGAGSNLGSIVFNSTKMGGDGTYEFYTVGVDVAGNREPAPVNGSEQILADASRVFSSGTQWSVINASTAIAAGNTTYDGKNLRITGPGVVVTLDGSHSFQNVELLNGASLTHSETTVSEAFALNFSAWTVSIDSSSAIDVTGRGYLGGNKAGLGETAHTSGFAAGSRRGNGGSYGGLGGHYSSAGADDKPNPVYGDLTNPMDLGSGGGAWSGAGGDGGGRVLINAVNLVLAGKIRANGGFSSGSASGEGSGGSVNLTLRTLSGSGAIQTDGGTTNGSNHTGGGGGRIAIRHIDVSTFVIAGLTAAGGDGYYGDGAAGTVFLLTEGQANGQLIINGQGANSPYTDLVLPSGHTFDTIILQNNARVIVQTPIQVSGTLRLTGNSILTHATASESGLKIEANRVEVEAGSAIDVTGRGYPGGNHSGYGESGVTLGNLIGSTRGC
ncbi:MAG: Ig-like domain-containing protein, partial [Pseudomonadota bacterium]